MAGILGADGRELPVLDRAVIVRWISPVFDIRRRGPAAEPVGNMEPRKPYDIANVLAAIAVLFFLAAAAVLFYWLSHGTAPPSLQGPPSATVR